MIVILALFAAASILNLNDAKWRTERNGSESVVVREDQSTGAIELLARYPGGHVFPPHWHTANERIILVEGRLKIGESFLDPGGHAYLPAREVQRMSCVSRDRCTFYVYWDSKLDFHTE
jgi:anti-sigma factor ChrR (cupin superfamily)